VAQYLLTTLLLPPLLLVLLAFGGGIAAWWGRRWGGLLAAAAALGLLLLATPQVAGLLVASLEREVATPAAGPPPEAIIVLGAEAVRDRDGRFGVGPLSLERLRAGAALHRATGLPLLVTGGRLEPEGTPLAALMAASLAEDFGVAVRWREEAAADTRQNAVFSAALLRVEGVGAAYVVTHGWHLPRALEAFARAGFAVQAAPLRLLAVPKGRAADWVPRADHISMSWYMLREWAGRLVYALRDGKS
jgi:uncharacterized SAM-binding protein YcdF (DUF218 family)